MTDQTTVRRGVIIACLVTSCVPALADEPTWNGNTLAEWTTAIKVCEAHRYVDLRGFFFDAPWADRTGYGKCRDLLRVYQSVRYKGLDAARREANVESVARITKENQNGQ